MAKRERKIVNIICSELYEKQLKEILDSIIKEDFKAAKSFKLYLDTLILNMPTKVKKYKTSIFFNDDNIKDLECQGYTIPFFVDEENNIFIVLGIVGK